jgi:hypothetical protein
MVNIVREMTMKEIDKEKEEGKNRN